MAHIDTLSSYLEDAAFMMHQAMTSVRMTFAAFARRKTSITMIPIGCFWPELVRNAVLCMIKRQELPMLAKFVSRWLDSEHLLLRRLALFAITEASDTDGSSECLHADLGAQMMINFPDILWSPEYIRESRRFLQKMGMKVSAPLLSRLEEIIFVGPPRSNYRDDIAEDDVAKYMREKSRRASGKIGIVGCPTVPQKH